MGVFGGPLFCLHNTYFLSLCFQRLSVIYSVFFLLLHRFGWECFFFSAICDLEINCLLSWSDEQIIKAYSGFQ